MTKKYLICLILFFTFLLCQVAEAGKIYAPPLQSNLSKNKARLIKLFNNAGIENAEDLFSDPRLKLHYDFWTGGGPPGDYPTIMTPESIERGKQIIIDNYEFLESVEVKYGVPKEILVSIFRVETNLGKYIGNYAVFNSLLTWTISGTRKWKWAQQELVTFLTICKQLSIDPFSVPGSTHGAFGLLQFIPTSFVRFAIPWKGEGTADLFNFEDAITSSANYLQKCGWNGTQKSNRKSIYAYNSSTPYVNVIFKYAKAIQINLYDVKRIRDPKETKEQEVQDNRPVITNEDSHPEDTEL
jgi:membrane-bound lytic murein transglycosylase B